ncbi:hypothetical protein Bhyg_10349 [Pseudolycoriella hygida]|uniref:Uncharacterized protein n=1 Tax=Pseudolycoriella hygida TaxID=35572 RepID=A0A9Q0RZ54_9DIPT|nr:hypothetical protein Bhyg_10349 [Pseudolycoriella hygida]
MKNIKSNDIITRDVYKYAKRANKKTERNKHLKKSVLIHFTITKDSCRFFKQIPDTVEILQMNIIGPDREENTLGLIKAPFKLDINYEFIHSLDDSSSPSSLNI